MYSPDTIKGVLEFCAREGQPTERLEEFLRILSENYKTHGKLSEDLIKELEYKSPY